VPVIVADMTNNMSALIALIENLQRQDLTYFEEAISYERLIKEFSYTQEELAAKLGKKQSTIANKIRLLRLGDEIKRKAVEYNLSERHCRALLKLDTDEIRNKALNVIISKNMNVLDAELYIDGLISQKTSKDKKERRILPLFKDIRIFTNTVKQAVEMMKKAGVPADSQKSETDEYIEYVIRIDKRQTQ
jgi:ParB family chromosome partitioning protein